MMKKTCKVCSATKLIDEFQLYSKKTGSYRGTCRECRTEQNRISRRAPERKYKEYKYEASRRELEFGLSFEQFSSFGGKPCHYCGDALDSIGLDRVDNSLGYFIGNVVSSCFTCNSIKHVYDKDDFLEHVERIFMYQQKVKNGKQESYS
jgi:hypothetical protein